MTVSMCFRSCEIKMQNVAFFMNKYAIGICQNSEYKTLDDWYHKHKKQSSCFMKVHKIDKNVRLNDLYYVM